MYLKNLHTGTLEKIQILEASSSDLKMAYKSKRFGFHWEIEKSKSVYKLIVASTNDMLGLVSLDNFPEEIRIDISLLEVSKENVGASKKYESIGGCLIAFACRLAFQSGYHGFVSFTPKTLLKKHYMDIYGFSEMGMKLYTSDENSEALIKKYLGG